MAVAEDPRGLPFAAVEAVPGDEEQRFAEALVGPDVAEPVDACSMAP
jgi:hypothetical protein